MCTNINYLLLTDLATHQGRLTHLWDRGFAGVPWSSTVLALQVRFVVNMEERQQTIELMRMTIPR